MANKNKHAEKIYNVIGADASALAAVSIHVEKEK
jgi:hypothetical protein